MSSVKSSFSRLFSKSKSPPPVEEKKQFTEPEKIKVAALYNDQQIKKRKSFVVEADVIIQDGQIAGKTPLNDPSAKVGCVLKPQQSLRDAMVPQSHAVQTWHKKSNSNSFSGTSSFGRAGSSGTSYRAPAASGVRNAFALEQALEALEEIQAEMKDLKVIIADVDAYSENTQLQKAMARLASQKKHTLQDKLNFIVFDGEDCHVFDKLKEKLHKALKAMSVDWSSGGLDLTSDGRSQSGSVRPPSTIGGSSVFGESEAPTFSREYSR
jgi:hypothetical protein